MTAVTPPLVFSNGTVSLPNVIIGPTNTAIGTDALSSTTGTNNTASGAFALSSNTTGIGNTATGRDALFSNITGSGNTASGFLALSSNTGSNNTANGQSALLNNTTGTDNTAFGQSALLNNDTGSGNIAIGANAGSALTTGSSNISIGNLGVAGESNTIRIGTSGTHTRAFIAGINGTPVMGAAVMVNSLGQLGTVLSSRRFKEEIQDMREASSGLLRLRPVTFRYKEAFADGARPVQYGLIAEEVAEVHPDLVVYSRTGEVETVQYHKLVPMLLNELQKQHRRIDALQAENAELKARLEAVERVVLSKEALAQK